MSIFLFRFQISSEFFSTLNMTRSKKYAKKKPTKTKRKPRSKAGNSRTHETKVSLGTQKTILKVSRQICSISPPLTLFYFSSTESSTEMASQFMSRKLTKRRRSIINCTIRKKRALNEFGCKLFPPMWFSAIWRIIKINNLVQHFAGSSKNDSQTVFILHFYANYIFRD